MVIFGISAKNYGDLSTLNLHSTSKTRFGVEFPELVPKFPVFFRNYPVGRSRNSPFFSRTTETVLVSKSPFFEDLEALDSTVVQEISQRFRFQERELLC